MCMYRTIYVARKIDKLDTGDYSRNRRRNISARLARKKDKKNPFRSSRSRSKYNNATDRRRSYSNYIRDASTTRARAAVPS